MEEEWVVNRSKLREVWVEHPEWSRQKMADEVGRSKSWVKKWLKRIRGAPLENQEVLRGKSRVRKRPLLPMEPKIVDKILEIRDHPPVLATYSSTRFLGEFRQVRPPTPL